jgi:hypothetical protein
MLTSLESGNKRGVVLVLAMLLLFYAKACGRRRYYIIIISVAHVYNTNSSVARLDISKYIIVAMKIRRCLSVAHIDNTNSSIGEITQSIDFL